MTNGKKEFGEDFVRSAVSMRGEMKTDGLEMVHFFGR